jgi:CBS domain-containing protein
MQVREFMTAHPACCPPFATVQDAARMMCDRGVGEIPVVDRHGGLVGVITDRDITCRVVAHGQNPMLTPVSRVMSQPVVTCAPQTDLTTCCRIMEVNQIRRLPVVDFRGCCVGIVSQADIARAAGACEAGEVVREVSMPSDRPSRVGTF